MSELSKKAMALAEEAAALVEKFGSDPGVQTEALTKATVATALATVALVQATEAQTNAIARAGGRR